MKVTVTEDGPCLAARGVPLAYLCTEDRGYLVVAT